MIVSSLPNTTVTLERATQGADASGGTTRAYATVGASFLVLLAPASVQLTSEYLRRNVRVDYVAYGNTDPGAKVNDRLNASGTFYVVMGVRPFSSSLGTTKVVEIHLSKLN